MRLVLLVVVARFRTVIEGASITIHRLRTSLALSYAAVQFHFKLTVLIKSRATSCVQGVIMRQFQNTASGVPTR